MDSGVMEATTVGFAIARHGSPKDSAASIGRCTALKMM
jgi:hypothetical protein